MNNDNKTKNLSKKDRSKGGSFGSTSRRIMEETLFKKRKKEMILQKQMVTLDQVRENNPVRGTEVEEFVMNAKAIK